MAKLSKFQWIEVSVGVFLLFFCTCGLVLPAVQKSRDAANYRVRSKVLNDVGESLRRHLDEKKRMPGNLDEFLPFVSNADVKAKLETGDIQVVWDAESFGIRDYDSNVSIIDVVMAWETEPDRRKGRVVLLKSGEVITMFEDVFRKAPKVRTMTAKK